MAHPRCWLVTGAAGFIGSHLVHALLRLDQSIIGLDNFSSGHQRNLDQVRSDVSAKQWAKFRFKTGDVRDIEDCRNACKNVDIVLHHAAFCSVPRSIEDPLAAHASNATGFMNMLVAAREAGVRRIVFASSSAVYGNHTELGLAPVEDTVVSPLSPYAATKYVDEVYAHMFSRHFGIECVGLRYFNVFGRRQDPAGPYAAVIPKWIDAMIGDGQVHINGDGQTTRDFCHVENIVQANLLAALSTDAHAVSQIYNIGTGTNTTLNELFAMIRNRLSGRFPNVAEKTASYQAFRVGDVRHSMADITKARSLLGYVPSYGFADGLSDTINWCVESADAKGAGR